MKKLNEVVLNITVAILDFLYRGRDYQRFWVLEEIARAPYFAFLSVLHLRESMGAYWVDRAFARHLVLIYYWVNVVYYWLAPRSAYHLSYEVEIHAAETYAKYLALNGHDDKILEILNDELHHSKELYDAMEMI
jgi:hypothetical protein